MFVNGDVLQMKVTPFLVRCTSAHLSQHLGGLKQEEQKAGLGTPRDPISKLKDQTRAGVQLRGCLPQVRRALGSSVAPKKQKSPVVSEKMGEQ